MTDRPPKSLAGKSWTLAKTHRIGKLSMDHEYHGEQPEWEVGSLDQYLTQPEATQAMHDAATAAIGREGPWKVVWSAMMEASDIPNKLETLSRLVSWQPIETAPKDETMFLAGCPDGRIMIWSGRIFALQNERTPEHLSFPATRWMPMDALRAALAQTQSEG